MEDRRLMKELRTGHERFTRSYKPFRTYLKAEEAFYRAIATKIERDELIKVSNNLPMKKIKTYEHMPKRMSTLGGSREIYLSTIPEIMNVVSMQVLYNEAFQYYLYYYVRRINDEGDVDIDYFVKFSRPIPRLQVELYGIFQFAKRYPKHTLLSPFMATAMAFERSWVSSWLYNHVQVEHIGTWKATYSEVTRYKCKVVYNPPDTCDDYYRCYIESEVFKHHHAKLKVINPVYYDAKYDEYYTQAKMPKKVIIRNATEVEEHSIIRTKI